MRQLTQLKVLVLKNNIKTYLLFLLVAGVWGTIAYKIINGLQPELPPTSNFPSFNNSNEIVNIKKDSFQINLPTRDPFLDRAAKTIKVQTPVIKSSQPSWTWPEVSYKGIIVSAQSKQQLFVLNHNQEQYLVAKGQELLGITIVSGNDEKLLVSYKGQRKWLTIQ